ncbi:subtilisin-like protease [Trifolium medium]|uniref:Subtilisin-like protease n=1 Tax=Trifolium medium TaxID=97028 RepID=A0A392P0J1_9FABA|nr:subtilisin-like protease [Trifolium medium]
MQEEIDREQGTSIEVMLPMQGQRQYKTVALNTVMELSILVVIPILEARITTYKACWPPINGSECFDADITAAFDMAIHDGVDVLSLPLEGSAAHYFDNGRAFHTVKRES